mmetsp:Transcript_11891/g.14147  ORF Transcript_11891/g.14147 Transcript_11891/m.14147 type:complete len:291 (+) Transcript_11891:329-1201(+)
MDEKDGFKYEPVPVSLLIYWVSLGGVFFHQILTNDLSWNQVRVDAIIRSSFIPQWLLLLVRVGAFGSWVLILRAARNNYHRLTVPVLGKNGRYHAKRLRKWWNFATFTIWAWIAQMVYFGIVASASVYSMVARRPPSLLITQLAWVLYELSLPTAFFVTIVVYGILVPLVSNAPQFAAAEGLLKGPISRLMHGANSGIMIFELAFNNFPLSFSHWVFPALFANIFAAFAWHFFRITGIFYYPFLDYRDKRWPIAWYTTLAAIYVGIYLICAKVAQQYHVYQDLIAGEKKY